MGGGEPSQNLLKLVREDLRLPLRTALYQAAHDRGNVVVENLQVRTDEGLKTINLLIRPVLREEDTTRGFILVIFEEAEQKQRAKEDSL